MLTENMFEKVAEKRKKSMIAPRQPQTCSHPIYARTLYRSLPDNHDVFSQLISCTCIHRNPGE